MSNIAAEKVLLAGAVQHPNKLLDVIEYITEEDFTQVAARITFSAINSLILNKEATVIT